MVQSFDSFREVEYQAEQWIRWYSEARSRQALGYRGPVEYRQQQALLWFDFTGARRI